MNNELRIGNFLQPKKGYLSAFGGVKFGVVTAIEENKFTVSNHYPCDWFEPVSITPENLLKLGAKEVANEHSPWYVLQVGVGDNCMEIVPVTENRWLIELISIQPLGFNVPKKFHFIHEIQNLYFDLTGEQLKFEQ